MLVYVHTANFASCDTVADLALIQESPTNSKPVFQTPCIGRLKKNK